MNGKVVSLIACAVWTSVLAADIVLENDNAAFVFSASHNFALKSIADKRTGTVFPFALDREPSLWAMVAMNRENVPGAVHTAPAPASVRRRENEIVFGWPSAELTVTLPPSSGVAEWRFRWQGTGAWPYSFEFPRTRVMKVGAADRLYYPHRLGAVLEDPVGRDFSVIPISPNLWSSQFALYSASPTSPRYRPQTPDRVFIDGSVRGARSDESTLYLAADDPAFWRKSIDLKGFRGERSFSFGLEHYPPWLKRPEAIGEASGAFSWTCPYVVRFGVVSGGVAEGVECYRRQNAERISADAACSTFVAQRPAWRSIHRPPADIARLAYNLRDFYRVPAVLHHYEGTLERFNWHFPEFRSYREHFRDLNEYLRSIDCRAMPYGNVMRFDRTLATYAELDGDQIAIRDMKGAMRGDFYKGVADTCADWGSGSWIDFHRRMVHELFACERVGGYYLDEGCGTARFDYNPAHGGIHGGTYVADGFRRFSDAMRAEARAVDPDAFLVTEGFGEHLIGHIDAFLVYGLKQPAGFTAHAAGFDHFPIGSYAVHDRTIGVSDHPDVTMSDDLFRLWSAQGWVWGLQTQALGTDEELGGANRRKAAYCREIVRSSWQVGSRYLASGESLFTASVTNVGEIGTAPIATVAAPCEIVYRKLPWRGPRVLSGAFRDLASGACALALANLKDEDSSVRILRDALRFAPNAKRLYRSWPLPVAELDIRNDIEVTVPANGVMLLEWRNDAPVPKALLPPPAPLPDWVATANAEVASADSARTYLAEFVPGTLCVTDAGHPGRFETALQVENHSREPLELTLEPGGRFRLPPMREARLPITVTAASTRDGVTVPVRISAASGRPKTETLRFGAVRAAGEDEVATRARPLKYPQFPIERRLPFAVAKGTRKFSFFPGAFGEVAGIIRTPEGEAVVWRKAADDFLAGTRFEIDVPEGADGPGWTYQHLDGKALVSLGDGVEPLDRSVLGSETSPTVVKGVGFECAENTLEVVLPEPSNSRRWRERFHTAFHGKFPEAHLRCDFPKPVKGTVAVSFRAMTKGGCRVRGYLQAFVRRPDGSFDVVASEPQEVKARRGAANVTLTADFAVPVDFIEAILRFSGSKDYRIDNLDVAAAKPLQGCGKMPHLRRGGILSPPIGENSAASPDTHVPANFSLFVSNHDQRPSHRVIHPIVGQTNFVFDAKGVLEKIRGEAIAFCIKDCENVTIRNVEIDWERPCLTEARVVGFGSGTTRVAIDRALFPIAFENGKIVMTGPGWTNAVRQVKLFDGRTHEHIPRVGDVPFDGAARELPDGTIELKKDFSSCGEGLKVGDVIVFRPHLRDYPAIVVLNSKNVLLEDVILHDAKGMGLIAQCSENVTWRGTKTAAAKTSGVFPRAGSYASAQADATHFSNVKGAVKVENCWFEGMMDDAINVHSTCVKVEKVERVENVDRVAVRFMHRQAYGFELFHAGDAVRFLRADTLEAVGTATVRRVIRESDRTLMLELAAGSSIPPYQACQPSQLILENATYQCAATFRNNVVCRNRARGALFSTPHPVLIESNRFDHVTGAALLFSGDGRKWYETGACEDVTIRGNIFSDCCTCAGFHGFSCGIIVIAPDYADWKQVREPYHRNFRIEGNVFDGFDVPVLYGVGAENIVMRDNRIRGGSRRFENRSPYELKGCRNFNYEVISKHPSGCGKMPHLRRGGILPPQMRRGFEITSYETLNERK